MCFVGVVGRRSFLRLGYFGRCWFPRFCLSLCILRFPHLLFLPYLPHFDIASAVIVVRCLLFAFRFCASLGSSQWNGRRVENLDIVILKFRNRVRLFYRAWSWFWSRFSRGIGTTGRRFRRRCRLAGLLFDFNWQGRCRRRRKRCPQLLV